MRLLFGFINICCVMLIFTRVVFAQEQPRLEYELIARLDIPDAAQVSWSPNGAQLAVTAWPTIQIWDTRSWELLETISDAPAFSNKWSPIGDMLAGVHGGEAETILIWNAKTGDVLREMTRPRPADLSPNLVLHTLAWSPDGNRIATDSGLAEDNLLIWDLTAEDNPQALVPGYPEVSGNEWINIAELEWSHNGQWLLGAGSDGNFRSRSIIRLWDAVTGETVRTIFPGFSPMWGKDDQKFAGLSMQDDEYVIHIWDTETGEIISTLDVGGTGMNTLSWNFDANVIAGWRIYEPIAIWEVDTGIRHIIEDLQPASIADIEWRPDSNELAIADYNEGVLILDFDFGE